MKQRFVFCFYIFFVSVFLLSASEDDIEFFTFGPESDTAFVLCVTSRGIETSFLPSVYNFLNDVSYDFAELGFQLVVAITHNDYTSLPADIAVEKYGGIKKLIENISKYKKISVCVFDDANEISVNYTDGNSKSPSWLLKFVHETFRENTGLNKYSYFLPNYFDTQVTEVLNLFFLENIPAILVRAKSDFDFYTIANSLVSTYKDFFSSVWEKNYVVFSYGNKLSIVSERTSIFFIIGFILIIFLTIFVLGLIKRVRFSKREFVRSVILYLLFFVLNISFLYLARFFTDSILMILFGSKEVKFFLSFSYIFIFALTYILLLCLADFFIGELMPSFEIFSSVLQNFFPSGSLINFFVLIGLKFFVYPFAFFTFIFSNFIAIQKNMILKIIVFVLFVMPSILYVLINVSSFETLLLLIENELFFLSVLFLPFIFTMAEKFFPESPKKTFLLFIAIVFMSIVGYTIALPFVGKAQTIPIEVRQSFDDNTNTTRSITPYTKYNDVKFLNTPTEDETSATYLSIEKVLENYLDRRLCTLTIDSKLNVEAIQIFISNSEGAPVYEVDKNFIVDGNVARILTSQNPKLPYTINFSSEKNATLDIEVKVFSYDNPFSTTIEKDGSLKFDESFILEASSRFKITSETND